MHRRVWPHVPLALMGVAQGLPEPQHVALHVPLALMAVAQWSPEPQHVALWDSPACSRATMVACSIRSRSMKLLKSSLYTLRSGSWNV